MIIKVVELKSKDLNELSILIKQLNNWYNPKVN